MTFADIKQHVQDRLKLTSTESATRIGRFVNERYRAVCTSVGMTPVRFGTVTFNTVASTQTYTPAGIIKVITAVYPAGPRVLAEMTVDQIRLLDPAGQRTGMPWGYAVSNYNAQTVTIRPFPIPDAAYAIQLDGILTGSDLSGTDVPVLPEDFHDIFVFGGCADELVKLEKEKQAETMEAKYTSRLRELRYFIAKTAYLGLQQNTVGYWWWGPWFFNYFGFR